MLKQLSFASLALINLLALVAATRTYDNDYDDYHDNTRSTNTTLRSYSDIRAGRAEYSSSNFASRNGDPFAGNCNRYLCRFKSVCGRMTSGKQRSLADAAEGSRISNGVGAQHGEFPQFVVVVMTHRFPRPGFEMCGGVLISDMHVLTAAHCVTTRLGFVARPDSVEVTFGDHSRLRYDGTEKKVKVKSVCRARRYFGNFNGPPLNDWAVITLRERVSFNRYIQPACLTNLRHITGRESECYIMGYGLSRNFDWRRRLISTLPDILQKMRVIKTSCWMVLRRSEDRSRHCFSDYYGRSANACMGDSGGPILCKSDGRYLVVGLVSYGPTHCTGGITFHTNIPNLLGDIQSECGI